MRERLMKAVFAAAAAISIAAVVLICLFLFSAAVPSVREIGLLNFLFGSKWAPSDVPPSYGILPMIIGSIYVTAGAIVIGVPIGVLCALFLTKFCPQKIYKPFKSAIDLLSGIPSVVYGFFGLVVIVPFIRNLFGGSGSSILTASILLGVMILPTIIGVSEAALRAVPDGYYEGALALGATSERSMFSVVLPAAKSGISAAVILGIGRAIGETMAVVLVCGNQPRIPTSLLGGVRTLTANIVLEMGYAADLHREALIATAAVLFVFILIINLLFSLLTRRDTNE